LYLLFRQAPIQLALGSTLTAVIVTSATTGVAMHAIPTTIPTGVTSGSKDSTAIPVGVVHGAGTTLATGASTNDFEGHSIHIGTAAATRVGTTVRAPARTISVIASDACIEWTIAAQSRMTLDTSFMIDMAAGTAA
jgi:hypothetical protein